MYIEQSERKEGTCATILKICGGNKLLPTRLQVAKSTEHSRCAVCGFSAKPEEYWKFNKVFSMSGFTMPHDLADVSSNCVCSDCVTFFKKEGWVNFCKHQGIENHFPIKEGKKPFVSNLPLSKTSNEVGDVWVYHCSSPRFKIGKESIISHYKRFNLTNQEYLRSKSRTIQLTKGKHKNWIFKSNVKYTKKVEWTVIGNKKKIKKLLKNCTHIGANRSIGMGKVINWEVKKSKDIFDINSRPIPIELAQTLNIPIDESTSIHNWGFRPSVRKFENKAFCIMP